MPVLAERDQVGRCPHCTHDSIELDGAGTVPMDKHREVAVGEGGLAVGDGVERDRWRSEEHTSELQSLMRISYDVFCLNKKQRKVQPQQHRYSPHRQPVDTAYTTQPVICEHQ